MRGRRTPRTERARDGYQVAREAPVRLNTGTLESCSTRRLARAELILRNDVLALGADLVAVAGGYAITTMSGREVLATPSTIRAVRAWIYGRQVAASRVHDVHEGRR